jgi:multidrug efflux system outer membrane protein
VAVAGLLAGCRTVGPDFVAPTPEAPAAFHHGGEASAAGSAAAAPDAWWTLFADPTLDALQASALRNHPTLAAAAARVEEARAARLLAGADQTVSLSLDAAAQVAGESAERITPLPSGEFRARTRGDHHRVPFLAAYELDLWGRVRRQVESADASFAATKADAAAVRLLLTAEVAATWYQARASAAERTVLARTRDLQRDEIALREARTRAGLSNEFDLARSRRELAQTEGELAAVSAQHDRLLASLASLCGRPLAAVASEAAGARTDESAPPTIPAGLPATVLARRPDVAAASARLHARTAEIGVAEAAFYPSIRLTGAAGFESAELGALLERPSQFWNVGPTLSLPLLDGGRREARLDAARARAAAAEADFRGVVLTALREVEVALIDVRLSREQADARLRALDAARDSLALARARHDQGLTSYLEVIDAERGALTAERAWSRQSAETRLALARLAGALGGGWDAHD